MTYPEHPENILLKNEFYRSGLKEIDVYTYYQNNKNRILNEVKDRNVIFFISTDINKIVVLRNIKGKEIKLTKSNFDTFVHPRVLSIHSTMNISEKIAIIDIDVNNWDLAKKATLDTFLWAIKFPPVLDAKIRYSGKQSFHIFCELRRKYQIDDIRYMFRNELQKSDFVKEKGYTVEHKRSPGIPNLDLSSNKKKGGFITLYSLSTIGLKCMEVPFHRVVRFEKRMAII